MYVKVAGREDSLARPLSRGEGRERFNGGTVKRERMRTEKRKKT